MKVGPLSRGMMLKFYFIYFFYYYYYYYYYLIVIIKKKTSQLLFIRLQDNVRLLHPPLPADLSVHLTIHFPWLTGNQQA